MWLSVFAMQLNIVKRKERKNIYIYIYPEIVHRTHAQVFGRHAITLKKNRQKCNFPWKFMSNIVMSALQKKGFKESVDLVIKMNQNLESDSLTFEKEDYQWILMF